MKCRSAITVFLIITFFLCVICIFAYAEDGQVSKASREGVLTVLNFGEGESTGAFLPNDLVSPEGEGDAIEYAITDSGKYKFTGTSELFDNAECYADFSFVGCVDARRSDYLVLTFSLATDGEFYACSDMDSSVCFSLFGEGSDFPFYISKRGNEWVLCSETNEAYANLGEISEEVERTFDFKLVFEINSLKADSSQSLHVYMNEALCYSEEISEIKDAVCFDGVRISFINTESTSVNLNNIKLEAVSGSDASNIYDLAYLFKSGAPEECAEISEWEKILYTIIDSSGKQASYSEIVTAREGTYSSVDAFREAINGKSSCSVSLKRNVIYDNESLSSASGVGVFTLPSASYTKDIYINGVTLAHNPYYVNKTGERESSRGQFFSFATSSLERTLNIIGGTNALGELSTLTREASGQSVFSANSGSSHANTNINFSELKILTYDKTDSSAFSDGNIDGAEWSFVHCDISFALSSTKFMGRSNAYDSLYFEKCKVNFAKSVNISYADMIFEQCDIAFSDVGINAANSSASVLISTSKISGSGAILSNNESVLTLGADVKLSSEALLTAHSYGLDAGCYLSVNKDSDRDVYPATVRQLSLVANLTLYSSIRYNLYLPDGEIDEINGRKAETLDAVTMEDGSVWRLYTIDFPVYEASEKRGVEIKPCSFDFQGYTPPTLNKSVSITEYAVKILDNPDGDNDYVDSYALISALVDYVIVSSEYFGESVTEAFSSLRSLPGYVASSVLEIPKSKTDKSALADAGYIKSFKLDVEKSEVRFVFTVGKAESVNVSYLSLDKKIYTTQISDPEEGEEISIYLRAYDLVTEMTISVDDGNVTGTYDLMAYAEDVNGINSEAYLLLVKMYNYSLCAKAYKLN